jgi:long-chain acyl-CoA synthetase
MMSLMNVVDLIRDETAPHRGRTALVEGPRSLTYAQLHDQVAALRLSLTDAGIGPGQRVAFRCPDGIDYIVGALAVLDCGAAVVPITTSSEDDEFPDTLRRIDVHGVLGRADLPPLPLDAPAQSITRGFTWQRRRGLESGDEPCAKLGAAFIRFSSGTTGASKGVVLSHASIRDRTDAANHGLEIDHQDVVLWVLGMRHHFVVSILLFLRRAATVVIAGGDFPFGFIEAAARQPVTFIYASPMHYDLLASSPAISPEALRHVRLAISTAMGTPRATSDAFAAKFNFRPAEAYGIIEVGLPFIRRDGDDAGYGSVGRVLPDYELHLDQPDANGVGRVMIRGKGLFDAYFSPWRLREQCLLDGWFDTGDLGRLDAAGRLWLCGRAKTAIISAGMKVFPEEVEEAINAVEGVAESLVFGQEHPQLDQVPVARIVRAGDCPDDDAALVERVRRYCGHHLSPYKIPIQVQVVSGLPKTASGKLLRRQEPAGPV